MTTRRRANSSTLFAELMLVAAATALVGVAAFAFRSTEPAVFAFDDDLADAGTGDVVELDDGAVADPDLPVAEIVADAAEAMGDVTSVEFQLERSGAPIYIDEFESLALDSLLGQFSVPGRARAQITVTVDDNLTTEIGAVAIDDEVWISNPVTGDFETLPPGFDIDPSRFFDPEDGWQPLLANLYDVELVGVDDRGGDRYHIRAVAPADQVEEITVGLVDGQDVPVDIWIHPGTFLVTRIEFETTTDTTTGAANDSVTRWELDLDRYGESFTIRPPANVRIDTGS